MTYVRATVNGEVSVACLVDTAANAAFVSRDLCADARTTVTAETSKVITLGTPAQTLGVARFDVELGSTTFPVTAHVVEIVGHMLLLPASFLRDHAGVIDFQKETLSLKGQKAPLRIFRSRAAALSRDYERPETSASRVAAFSSAVDDESFIRAWTAEHEKWSSSYSSPDRQSIASRVRMGDGATDKDLSFIVDALCSRAHLARVYPRNTPPPLPLAPLRLPFKPGAIPPHVKQWPISPSERAAKAEVLKLWLQHGIAERSDSFGNVPFFYIKKADGTWRPVVDARAVNELLERRRHGPPLLSMLHSWLAPAKFVSSVDAASFFNSFVIDKESRRFFAFDGGDLGRLQLTRLPQGCSVAPALASAFLERVLQPVADVAVCYVDNIVIRTCSDDPSDHRRDILRVLDCLSEERVTLNLGSSFWCGVKNVPVMGILWSRGQACLAESRTSDLLAMPKPLRLSQVRAMTAALGTMSTFIPHGQLLASPFNKLIGEGRPFRRTPDLESAWESLRRAVATAFATVYPRPGDELIVRSDASTVGWGGVLLTRRGDELHPVAFVSRTWKGAEGRYSAVRREALALLNVVVRLQQYIKGDPKVRYETDSFAVSRILSHPGDDHLATIGMKLSEMGVSDDSLHHIKGDGNAMADWGSRVPVKATTDSDAYAKHLATSAAIVSPFSEEGIVTREQQLNDPELRNILETSEEIDASDGSDVALKVPERAVRDIMQRYRILDGMLMRLEFNSERDPDSEGRLVVVVPHDRQR